MHTTNKYLLLKILQKGKSHFLTKTQRLQIEQGSELSFLS